MLLELRQFLLIFFLNISFVVEGALYSKKKINNSEKFSLAKRKHFESS